ncbi:MAG: hypothetical protein FWE22_02740 [Firmicutes bacterium]|nr:hypothetical protein [Bacillota bacterium]
MKTLKRLKLFLTATVILSLSFVMLIGCGINETHNNVWQVQVVNDPFGSEVTLTSNVYIRYGNPVRIDGNNYLTAEQYFIQNFRYRFGIGNLGTVGIGTATEWEPPYRINLTQDGEINVANNALRHAFVVGNRIGYSKQIFDPVFNPIILNYSPPTAPVMRFVMMGANVEWLETRVYNFVPGGDSGYRSAIFALFNGVWTEVEEREDLTFFFVEVLQVLRNYLSVELTNSGLVVTQSRTNTIHRFNFDLSGDVREHSRIYDRHGNLLSVHGTGVTTISDILPAILEYNIRFFTP